MQINKSFTYAENSIAPVLMRNINSVLQTDSKSSDVRIWTEDVFFPLHACSKGEIDERFLEYAIYYRQMI